MTPDQPFTIRLANQDDAEAIAEVHLQSHRETYPPLVGEQNYWPSGKAEQLAQWQQTLAGQDGGRGIAFVAVAGGRVVGFTHAVGEQMTTLYILAAWHRRGIGRALLTRLCQALAARGIARARFAVLAVNSAAIRFYEALGAEPAGSIEIEEQGIRYEDRLFEIVTGG
jgi:ribosomal protein S18 acetylase RimI-like enzyme